MQIQIASDLHTEMYRDYGRAICESLVEAGGADVLVLAGDIASARYIDNYMVVMDELTPYYKHIVLTTGNHEYYLSDSANVNRTLERLEGKYGNLHVLRNDYVTLDGQRFIGGTSWFMRPTFQEQMYKMYMNDFNTIRDLESFCYKANDELRALLTKELHSDDILVTHHIPATSIHPKYAKNALNCFFWNGLDEFYGIPKLAIHGHTHLRMDYNIENTRVIANPLGYPNETQEQAAFLKNLIVTV